VEGRTATRTRVLAALEQLSARHGRPPTVREIARALGYHSTAGIHYHLDMLVQLGLVQHMGGARGYVAAGVRPPAHPAAARSPGSPRDAAVGQ
jgi:SOS-response transcriptional repressor LexA